MTDKDLSFETNYLIKNEDRFFETVFKGEPRYIDSLKGMIAAHSDKCEQYRDYWLKYRIPFRHAVFVYLLTYTKVFGETPKHLSREWVVVNYHLYEELLNSF